MPSDNQAPAGAKPDEGSQSVGGKSDRSKPHFQKKGQGSNQAHRASEHASQARHPDAKREPTTDAKPTPSDNDTGTKTPPLDTFSDGTDVYPYGYW